MTMTRKGPSPFAALFLVTALVVCSQLAPRAEAECNVMQLKSCTAAFTPPKPPPTDECCAKLKEQQPCLCNYMKNPRYGNFVKSPRAKEILQDCQVPYPQC